MIAPNARARPRRVLREYMVITKKGLLRPSPASRTYTTVKINTETNSKLITGMVLNRYVAVDG